MKRALIAVGGFPVLVEVAETEDEQRHGLMGRRRLPDGHGMLFRYGEDGSRSFWMKDTPLPLDLAYVADGEIVSVHKLEPNSEASVSGHGDSALELPVGWLADHGVGQGHRVRMILMFGEVGNG